MTMDSISYAKSIIQNYNGRKLKIMEVCGTHTHEIFRLGIRNLLPDSIELISGPGCPVCVTPVGYIDQAITLCLERNVTICTFGDLVRVPSSNSSLAIARSKGGKVQVVYSPIDAVDYAIANPNEDVTFLAVGFETTTPASCLAVKKAKLNRIKNFSLLVANKTMPNAYEVLKDSANAFLYPGHVHAITGTALCKHLAEAEGVSGVVTGFTAKEILTALAVIVERYKLNEPFFENCYPRVVTDQGNVSAQSLMAQVMQPCDAEWRGLGVIKGSGLKLNALYSNYDAKVKYQLKDISSSGNSACRCGEILKGDCKPYDCPLFGKVCTPIHPIGACMVSNEGTCSAYYQYGGTLNG